MLVQITFVYFAFLAVSNAALVDEDVSKEWNSFKLQYGKNYDSSVEDEYRFNIFKETKFAIAENNKLFAENKITYEIGLNYFADMMPEEISTGFYGDLNNSWIGDLEVRMFVSNQNITLPANFDWRLNGVVTPVKNQGTCEAGWAFAATGALEAQHSINKHRLVSLSAQNLIDCSPQPDRGCSGGSVKNAFEYIKANGGINTETAYPYEGENLPCRYDASKAGETLSTIFTILKKRENQLMEAVALRGPVAAAINSKDSEFQHYKHGIYDNSRCLKEATHAVLIVGYGTEKGKDYWLVKNSWGTEWGIDGYIKMARGKNLCGIAENAIYPGI